MLNYRLLIPDGTVWPYSHDTSHEREELMASYNWTGWVWKSNPVEVQDFWTITERFRGIYGTFLKSLNEKPKDANM
jgi:hypothetical protein